MMTFLISLAVILYVGLICGFVWTTRTPRRIIENHKSIVSMNGVIWLVFFHILLLIVSPWIAFAVCVELITKTK